MPKSSTSWPKGKSGNPKGRPRKDEKQLRPGVRQVRVDDWVAALSGIGNTSYDKRTSVYFDTPQLISSAEAQLIWRGNDLAARIIETKPSEMLREGFDLCIGATEDEPAEGEDTGEEYEP